jgi:hypothetical protein
MNPIDAANAVVALAALVGFVCLFYGPWQSICTDISRQAIFERRDRLFNLAASGRIAFDSVGYQAARRRLNNMLRFAHEMTWPDLVIGYYFLTTRGHVSSWKDTLETIPADIRDEIDELVKECSATLSAMMAMKSIVLAPAAIFGTVFLVCTKGLSWLLRKIANQKRFEPFNETVQAAAINYVESEMAHAT